VHPRLPFSETIHKTQVRGQDRIQSLHAVTPARSISTSLFWESCVQLTWTSRSHWHNGAKFPRRWCELL